MFDFLPLMSWFLPHFGFCSLFFLSKFLYQIICYIDTWIEFCFQERIPVEEVFAQLKCTKEGLSSEDGKRRLEIFGFNKLEERSVIILDPCLLEIFLMSSHVALPLPVAIWSWLYASEIAICFNLMNILQDYNFFFISGKQNSEVFGIYVESPVLGDGSSSNYGNCIV